MNMLVHMCNMEQFTGRIMQLNKLESKAVILYAKQTNYLWESC